MTGPASHAARELDEGLTAVRSPQTSPITMLRHPEGVDPVHQTLHQNDVDHLVHDRIGDLYSTAREIRPGRRDGEERAGIVTRTRWTIGRRLVSIGHTVSGSHV